MRVRGLFSVLAERELSKKIFVGRLQGVPIDWSVYGCCVVVVCMDTGSCGLIVQIMYEFVRGVQG